ncbi:hypothetical protein HW561_19520 [Rhodobacteraceae bacterium B1Z28]|uniref:HEPN AbiU2-like domain-containing protein n=1 Tax=Ruegeria haliotis TaxID=2747601 RepID=A0ABX2PY54_9RHOB|nr:hypothetical protein [Ruegeria haliotis]NVO57992.1 hypothetical protein [Ruegeria haliotis]
MNDEIKSRELNLFHEDYKYRLREEFDFLLGQTAFAEVFFANHQPLYSDEEASFVPTLDRLFQCSFEGLALSLARVWDFNKKRSNSISLSLPNLVQHFADHRYLGCRCLSETEPVRAQYESLFKSPMCEKLRVVRTEALAHSISVGRSRDRQKFELPDKGSFGIINGELVEFANETLALLYSVVNDLHLAGWSEAESLLVKRNRVQDNHVSFLKFFCPDVSYPN